MPVDPATLGAFVIAIAAIVMSPGPDTIIILRHTLSSGRGVGFGAVASVQLGLMVHTGLAVTGISLIVASSPLLFKILAVAGAAYLAWLGIQGFRDGGAVSLDAQGQQVGMARACREATLCNVLNPKVIVLFLALLPNFVDTNRDDVTAQLATLAVVLILINVVWQVPMVWLADGIRRWLGRAEVIRALSRITGCVLLALSAYMLFEHLG